MLTLNLSAFPKFIFMRHCPCVTLGQSLAGAPISPSAASYAATINAEKRRSHRKVFTTGCLSPSETHSKSTVAATLHSAPLLGLPG